MKTIDIANGVSVSEICLGLGALGVFDRAEECFAVMDRYLECGGTCIDSARMYENGETDRVVGEWLRRRGNRNKVTLCTKGAYPTARVTPEHIRADLEANLAAMGIDCADLYLLHRDNVEMPVEEIMPVLDKLVKEGKTRTVGASNWTAGRIAEANAFAKANGLEPFSVSQILYSLARTTTAQTGDLTHIVMNDVEYDWYLETQLPVIAYSSQAKGYFARYAAGREQKANAAKYFAGLPDNERRAKRLVELAALLKTTPAALSLAYLRASKLKVSALAAFSSIPQLEESLAALNIDLTPEQVAFLEHGK